MIRIVKMTFRPEEVNTFLQIFNERKEKIRHFPGCTHLELLRDLHDSSIFFTYSFWDNHESLEAYRHSGLFKETWNLTKALFAQKPEAWSVHREFMV